MCARLLVRQVFDLPSRSGLAVAGVVEEGTVTSGTQLTDLATGQVWTVLGVDFLRHEDENSVLVARIPGVRLVPGAVLVEQPNSWT